MAKKKNPPRVDEVLKNVATELQRLEEEYERDNVLRALVLLWAVDVSGLND